MSSHARNMADAVDEDLAVRRLHHTTNMDTEATRYSSCSDAQVARFNYLGEINHSASSSNNKPLKRGTRLEALTQHHATQLNKQTIKPAAVQPCKQASKQPTTNVRDARKLSFPSLWTRPRFGNIMRKVFADEAETQHVPTCGESSAWT